MKHLVWISTALAVMTFFALPTWAMRCGGGLVDVGSTMETVLEYCGEPLKKEVIDQKKSGTFHYDRLHKGVSKLEYWHYDHGSGMITLVKFLDGKVVDIKSVPKWIPEGNAQDNKAKE